jgi:hypothetical protein
MASLLTLVAELLASVLQLVVIFVRDVALRDPLAFVSFVVGAGLTTLSVLGLAYLALGAFVDWLGGVIGTPRQPPQQAR